MNKPSGVKMLVLGVAFILVVNVPYYYVETLYADGDISKFGEKQLANLWHGMFSIVAPYLRERVRAGETIIGIDVWKTGLQYQLGLVPLIDLAQAENLAAMRQMLTTNSSSIVLRELENLAVRFIVVRKAQSTRRFMDLFSQHGFFGVLSDLSYFTPRLDLPAWRVYEFNPAPLLLDWTLDISSPPYLWLGSSDACNAFIENGSLRLEVQGEAGDRCTLRFSDVPTVSIDENRFVRLQVQGTPNGQWSFRLFFADDESFYYPYWIVSEDSWQTLVFDLSSSPRKSRILRGDAYLSFQTVNGSLASLEVRLIEIVRRVENP